VKDFRSAEYWIRSTLLLLMLISFKAHADQNVESMQEQIGKQQALIDSLQLETELLKKKNNRTENDDSLSEYEADKKYVLRKWLNGEITLSGRIHRVVMQVDDGVSKNNFFMDSDQGPTMLRMDISAFQNSGWLVSGALEIGIQNKRSFHVSQNTPNPGTDIQVREVNVNLNSKLFGKFSLGRGISAAWIAPEIDLSGTVPAAMLSVGTLAPGMLFTDRSNNQLTDIRVHNHFVDTERLLLVDRFRYDSPSFGNNLQVSGTIAADSRWDMALRYYPTLKNWTLRSAVTYLHKPFQGLDNRIELGVSARHNETGLSLTLGGAYGDRNDGEISRGYIGKLGWLINLNSLGNTAFSIDYSKANDVRILGDSSKSVGLFAYQKWDNIGLDLYTGYRTYEVTRPDINLFPLDIFVFGIIFNF